MTGRQVSIWHPSDVKQGARAESLTECAQRAGGAAVLQLWRQMHPGARLAHVDGQRHDLWWEFALGDSFRWQNHLYRLPPGLFRRRFRLLADALNLSGLMQESAAALTPSQRAAANLAVALLPGPEGLVWEEPFLELERADRERAVRLVRRLCASEGLTVLALAARPPGLIGLGAPPAPVQAVR